MGGSDALNQVVESLRQTDTYCATLTPSFDPVFDFFVGDVDAECADKKDTRSHGIDLVKNVDRGRLTAALLDELFKPCHSFDDGGLGNLCEPLELALIECWRDGLASVSPVLGCLSEKDGLSGQAV